MKSISLTKVSSDHIFSHIYEHIFKIMLRRQLSDINLFENIDYILRAYTEDAQVTVELQYDEDGELGEHDFHSILKKLQEQEITEDEFLVANAQVMSEYGTRVAAHDEDTKPFLKELNAFHKQAWGTDELYQLENQLIKDRDFPTKQLNLVVEMPIDQPEILANFKKVAGLVLAALAYDYADSYGGYVNSNLYETNHKGDLQVEILLPAESPYDKKYLSELLKFYKTHTSLLKIKGVKEDELQKILGIEGKFTHHEK